MVSYLKLSESFLWILALFLGNYENHPYFQTGTENIFSVMIKLFDLGINNINLCRSTVRVSERERKSAN